MNSRHVQLIITIAKHIFGEFAKMTLKSDLNMNREYVLNIYNMWR